MKTKQQKLDMVSDITAKLARAKSLVFTDYQGLTMSKISVLRKELKVQGAEFTVTKNSLLKIALENSQFPVSNSEFLTGPVATLFAYDDEITPIKTLVKSLKDFAKGTVKAGFLGTEYLDQYQLNSLAKLPSKAELQAKVVGTLAAPIIGIVGVLNSNLRGLVITLDQIRQTLAEKQKGGEK